METYNIKAGIKKLRTDKKEKQIKKLCDRKTSG